MYDYPFWSPLYLTLTFIYFLSASVVTLDIRLIQAKRQGEDFGELPKWTVIFNFLQWGLFVALAVLNWKSALIIFAVKFVLKVLPVLETIGNILMSPFKPKRIDELRKMSQELSEKTGIDFSNLDHEKLANELDEIDQMKEDFLNPKETRIS